MSPRCGTREAIIAHRENGELLDGPCAGQDLAMRLETAAMRPYLPSRASWDDSPKRCAQRRRLLVGEVLAFELARRVVTR